MRHVIIGAGPAGVRAAEAIRDTDRAAHITMLSDEPGHPYARMAIPYLVGGRIEEAGARQRHGVGHFDDLNVDYLNRRAVKVTPTPEGGTVLLDDGSVRVFDRLLIATGSHPTMPPFPGTDLPGVVCCWTLDDAAKIKERLKPGARVVLVGAGFVAGTVMRALVESEAHVSVIAGRTGQILRSMMTPAGSDLLRRWLEKLGVNVISKGKILRIDPGPTLVMDTGALPMDLIILAAGVRTNTGCLEGTGVAVDEGILVDDHMRTNVPCVYAAGDVAQGRDFSTGEWVVHALQPTATEHGRIAGMNMAGANVAYHGSLSMNVLDLVGLLSHAFGRWQGVPGGEVAEEIDNEAYRYMRLCFDGDRLIGALTIGPVAQVGSIRGMILARTPLGPWKDRLLKTPSLISQAYVATLGQKQEKDAAPA